MANTTIGKKWESKFESTWIKQFPDKLIYRLPDQQGGYAGEGGSNPCDFLCYPGDCVLMVECKAHKGASISFNDIPQYERQLKYKGKYKTFPGVLVWFYEKDKIIWVSIEEMEKMVKEGEKSIGLRMIDPKKPQHRPYQVIELPAKKLRTFMEPELNYLIENLEEAARPTARNFIDKNGHFVHVDYKINGMTLADIEEYCEKHPSSPEVIEEFKRELEELRADSKIANEEELTIQPISYIQKYIDEFEKNKEDEDG